MNTKFWHIDHNDPPGIKSDRYPFIVPPLRNDFNQYILIKLYITITLQIETLKPLTWKLQVKLCY